MKLMHTLVGLLLATHVVTGSTFAEPFTTVYKIHPPPVTPADFRRVDSLRKTVISRINPKSWYENEGAGQILQVNNSLVIYNNLNTQKQIGRLSKGVLIRVTKNPKNPLSKIQKLKNVSDGMQKPIDVEFNDDPFDIAIDALSHLSKINITIDSRALDNLGIDTETPITCSYRNIPTLVVLNLILKEIDPDLTWMPTAKGISITTLETAENNLFKQTYNTGMFVKRTANPQRTQLETLEAIASTVAPLSWDQVGGPAMIRAMPNGDIAVMQTAENHIKILQLLINIEAANLSR